MEGEKTQLCHWEGKSFSYFCNRDCEFFPCHTVPEGEDFNCLFCYCPLYALGRDCGGSFEYLDNGVKDCSACLLPHRRENYGYITERFKDLVEKMRGMERVRPSVGKNRSEAQI